MGIHTMVGKALKVAEQLAEEGIELEVIDPRTLVPLDEQAIVESVKKTGRLIVSHEAYRNSGYGAELVSRVVEAASTTWTPRRCGSAPVTFPCLTTRRSRRRHCRK